MTDPSRFPITPPAWSHARRGNTPSGGTGGCGTTPRRRADSHPTTTDWTRPHGEWWKALAQRTASNVPSSIGLTLGKTGSCEGIIRGPR